MDLNLHFLKIIAYAVPMFGTDVPLIVLWLIAGGVFFTLYLNFINFRGFKHALDIVRGKFVQDDDPGQISQFQALTTAVSGTVGIGNIAGVAVAIGSRNDLNRANLRRGIYTSGV